MAEPHPELRGLLAAQLREDPREGAADQMGRLGIQLLAVDAADVICLEDPGRGSGDRHQSPNAFRTVS